MLFTNRWTIPIVQPAATQSLSLSLILIRPFTNTLFLSPATDMVAFERWLEDPAFATVLYMSDEGDSFIGYCDSLSTHLSAIYRKSVLFWPCPRMKVSESGRMVCAVSERRLARCERLLRTCTHENAVDGCLLLREGDVFFVYILFLLRTPSTRYPFGMRLEIVGKAQTHYFN